MQSLPGKLQASFWLCLLVKAVRPNLIIDIPVLNLLLSAYLTNLIYCF